MHARAAPVDVVDHVADRLLVAGDDARRQDHGVVGLHRHLAVIADRDADERRQRLALTAGDQQRHLARIKLAQLADVGEQRRRALQVAELRGDLEAVLQAAADRHDAAPVALRQLDHLRQPVHVRRERREEDLARCLAEDAVEIATHRALGRRIPLALDVGRVRQQQQDTLGGVLGQTLQIGGSVVDRRLVELEVAAVDDRAERRADRQRHGVDDRVGHVDRFDRERSHLPRLARPHHLELRRVEQVVLAQLLGQQARRHRRGVHRHRQVAQHVRQRADVIFVAVRDDEAEKAVAEPLQVGEIGNDQVDAEHVQLGKHQAAVDGDRRVAVLEHQAIETDLAEPAERDDTQQTATVGAGQLSTSRVLRGERPDRGRIRESQPWTSASTAPHNTRG